MSIGSMIRGVIFDLDGVIADSHPVHELAWSAPIGESGKRISDLELQFIREGRTRTDILKFLFRDSSDNNWPALGQRKQQLYQQNIHALRPMPGVLDWIRNLNGASIPLAVATCASRERAIETLNRFGIERCFDAVVTSSDVRYGKPDPGLFLRAASELRIAPHEILVVEDSVSGLAAAKAAGMACVLFSQGECDAQILALRPDAVLQSFRDSEIREALAGLHRLIEYRETERACLG
jgi:HAD superfamily hydrolase (TIGR01509 family)